MQLMLQMPVEPCCTILQLTNGMMIFLKSLNIPKHILPDVKDSSDYYGLTHASITGKSYSITGVVGRPASCYDWTMLFLKEVQ